MSIGNCEKIQEAEYKKWNIEIMHSMISHLFDEKPHVYWIDLLVSAFIGWSFFITALSCPFLSTTYLVCLLVASIALYRALSFMHELVHLRKRAIPGFHLAWTLLVGVPLMVPSFLYTDIHLSHHNKNKFGTDLDGEYAPFAWSSVWVLLKHFSGHFLLPIFILARFIILAPISFLYPKARKGIKENLSGISIKMPFKREVSNKKEDQFVWLYEEIFTCIFIWMVLVGVYFDFVPKLLILHFAISAILIALLNSIRTIGATHRYLSLGQKMSFQHQFKDSVNISSSRLDNLLICPVGLRFHALHHLFPGMPYHALQAAHECLSGNLPIDHEYHQSTLPTVWVGWKEMLDNIKKNKMEILLN